MVLISVLLHNIRSTHNVGSIFRTADAAGVLCMYLTGYTPTPVDRFGRVRKDVAKTALGAERCVLWSRHASPTAIIKRLRVDGYSIIGVEQGPGAIDYRSFKPTRPTLFIFGNEVRGISPALRAQCDELIEIPMNGTKESLNVSVTAGIILFSMKSHRRSDHTGRAGV